MVEIRSMAISDYAPVYAIWYNSPEIGVMSLDDSRESIEAFLRMNKRFCLVAIDEVDVKEVIGAVLCGFDGRRAYIYHLAVADGYRGKGIGKMLVETLLERLKADKVNKVSLVAFKDNDFGKIFWEHMGFRLRDDLVFMDRQINMDNQWVNKDIALR